jgi:tubulin-folding cofactor B
MTVSAVKVKIYQMCGTNTSTMILQLRDEAGSQVAVLADDCRKLGYYSPRSGCAGLLSMHK